MSAATDPRPLAYGRFVEPEARGYATGEGLMGAYQAGRLARSWWLGPRLVSGQAVSAEGRGLWKATERLPTGTPETLLPALEAAGVHHPASYADAYHQLAPRSTMLRAGWNRLFEWWPGGPWAEAKLTGELRGRWYRYDLRQAYRWAATLGLPVPDTFRFRRRWIDAPGLWVGELLDVRPDLPAIFRRTPPVVMSTEEIVQYGVRFHAWRGVTWERTHPADYVERTLALLPCPNESGRAYWGRWISRDPLVCKTAGRTWELKANPWRNFVWGWLIVGRVRLRVWEVAAEAAHVYVDEVVLPHPLPETPDVLGSWRPKEEYPDGLTVHRVGSFGPRDGPPSMQTGVPRDAA